MSSNGPASSAWPHRAGGRQNGLAISVPDYRSLQETATTLGACGAGQAGAFLKNENALAGGGVNFAQRGAECHAVARRMIHGEDERPNLGGRVGRGLRRRGSV